MERKNGAKTSLFIFNKKIRKRWFKKKEAFKTDLGFGRGDAPTPFEISDARIGFIDSVENNLIESFLMGLMKLVGNIWSDGDGQRACLPLDGMTGLENV